MWQSRRNTLLKLNQFFVFKDRSPVMPFHVRQMLKKVLIINNLDPSLYCSHAFRAGRAGDLLKAGV